MARWVVEPDSVAPWLKSTAYISLIALALLLTTLRGWTRIAVLVPMLYLATFVWENVLAVQPEVTRYILLGSPARGRDDRPSERPSRREAGGDRLVAADVLLELRGVTMTFGGLTVVESLDLHVDEGEIVSVIGPNGAGKTTFFNLDHAASTSRPTATSSSPGRASEGSTRTRSPSGASRGRSRRCGCSST